MAYKEIVTKAIIGKGKKKYKNNYQVTVEETPTTILGCWIINHVFEAKEIKDKIVIDGSFDANIWYAYDNDTKTAVTTKRIAYEEEEKLAVDDNNVINKAIIIRSLKQPTCIKATEDGNTIDLEIEKELGIEIIGDTKVKISSLDDEEEWENLDNTSENIKTDEINTNYIKE